MTSRDWTLVGFHAFDAAVFQKLIDQDKTDEWYIDIKPMIWSSTRMQAISHTRKAAVKKLGITLSDTPEPSPKAKSAKKRSTCMESDAFGPEGWQQSNYVIFRLQTKENLALSIATRTLIPSPYGLEMREHVTMQPVILMNVDHFGKKHDDIVIGAQNQTDMLYTYYVPLPKTQVSDNLVEVLDCTKANPLLRMFMMSSTSGAMKEMLSKVLSGVELSVLPWMASSLSAMNVGFFAYKPTTSTIHAGQEASDELHLLTLRTKTLLGGVAPHQHPLGPVWVETTNFIITMLQSKEASLTIQEYKISMTNTGDFYPQETIVEKNRAQRLANRKRKLEEDNHELGKTMVMNKAEIAEIERQLRSGNAEAADNSPDGAKASPSLTQPMEEP
eukprot:s1300_g11.t1